MLAFNCYHDVIECISSGLAAPTDLIREARHEQSLTCHIKKRHVGGISRKVKK